jgi:hypothetical protein
LESILCDAATAERYTAVDDAEIRAAAMAD